MVQVGNYAGAVLLLLVLKAVLLRFSCCRRIDSMYGLRNCQYLQAESSSWLFSSIASMVCSFDDCTGAGIKNLALEAATDLVAGTDGDCNRFADFPPPRLKVSTYFDRTPTQPRADKWFIPCSIGGIPGVILVFEVFFMSNPSLECDPSVFNADFKP